jgi:hypothetical protein
MRKTHGHLPTHIGHWQATNMFIKNCATIDDENTKRLAHHKVNDVLGWLRS